MALTPTYREQQLMNQLGFRTVESLVEFLNEPVDMLVQQRISPVYPDDESDLGEDDF